jgi:SAM-dependent methyltransferase
MLDQIAIKSIIKGLLTFIPGWQWIRRKEGGGANSARYCYAVWLRHLSHAAQCGATFHPDIVAELGPGDSIGTGLAAILSGCKVYLAFDIVPFTALAKNLRMFEELVELFRNRTPIPDDAEFPDLYPRLHHYDFPAELYPGDHLVKTLEESRVRAVGEILLKGRPQANGIVDIRYVAPWDSPRVLEANSADMIFSQAVMEHVDDLRSAYEVMYQWLKPGSVMSHEIDFKCHGTAKHWNGHWTYPDPVWRIIKGRRPYYLNRQTCGHHLELIRQAGFKIAHISRQERTQSILRADLCSSLRNAIDEDLCTSSAHIIALKK